MQLLHALRVRICSSVVGSGVPSTVPSGHYAVALPLHLIPERTARRTRLNSNGTGHLGEISVILTS
jgi:hypothetical protein